MVVRRISFSSLNLSSVSEIRLAAALGNYDGLHLGHQRILSELVRNAADKNLAPALITFYPHPREFFANEQRRPPLLRFGQRVLAAADLRVQQILALRFNAELAKLSGPEFLRLMVQKLGVRLLLVGRDSRIGKGREMDVEMMRSELSALGAELIVVGDVTAGADRISATQVRLAVQSGDVIRAYSFLGRAYSLTGRIVRGDGRGSGIGVPTINLSNPRQLMPASGVYLTRAIVSGKSYPAVTNVGVRPTFNGSVLKVESHLLDGPYPKMYGEKAQVEFLERLRPERRFDTVEDLISAIRADISSAREKHGLKK